MEIRRVTEEFSVSPQIAPEDLAELKGQGFALVINNRPDGEEPGQPAAAEIEAAAEAAGIAYRAIPIAGGLAHPQVEAMALALEGASGPVFAYCRTGTRSTLLWSLAEASRGGAPYTIAEAAAKAGYDITPVRSMLKQFADLAATSQG